MLDLKSDKISYILISSNKGGLNSYLYSREYNIFDLKKYYEGKFDDSIIAFTNLDSNSIRRDSIHIMDHFDQESIIVKYKNETSPIKMSNSGYQNPLDVVMYNTDSKNISYILEGISFSFINEKVYQFPRKKTDFKKGMLVECFSNNKWIERIVGNVDVEYEKMYNLLIKYDKVRIPSI